jgi:hypothetical protein
MAKAPKAKKPLRGDGTAGSSRSLVWLSGLACGALASISPGIAMLAAGLLMPGVVVLKLDKEPGRPIARTVLTCGLAGCVQPVITLWNAGQSFDAALSILSDPRAIGLAWSAAGAGWLLSQVTPLIVRAVLEATSLARTARLRATRGRIVEAWGLEETPDG